MISEAIAALFGRDLGLRVPEPFLLRIDDDFAASMPNEVLRQLAAASVGWNFGSKRLPPGFMPIPIGRGCPHNLLPTAGEVFMFDAMIQNPDRRPGNPNCLLKGEEMAIIDHELAFAWEGMIGWKPPWEPNSLESLRNGPGRHLFAEQLSGKAVSLERLGNALKGLDRDGISTYRDALPEEWVRAVPDFVKQVFEYLVVLRGKFPDVLLRVQEALR